MNKFLAFNPILTVFLSLLYSDIMLAYHSSYFSVSQSQHKHKIKGTVDENVTMIGTAADEVNRKGR